MDPTELDVPESTGLSGEEDSFLAEEPRLGSSEKGIAANGVILSLSRAARSFLLYDPSNEAIRHFLDALRKTTEGYLARFGDLVLEIRPFEIVAAGEIVYLERDRERSLAFRLYRDGVRKLTVHPSLTWHESLKLLEVLSIRYSGVRQTEDDMVVLLWKAGFQNIEIEAVEGFVADEEHEAGEGGQQTVVVRGTATVEAPPDFDLPIGKIPGLGLVRFLTVPAPALEELQAEDNTQALPELAVRLLEELVAMASDPVEPVDFNDVLPQLREVRDFLLAENHLAHIVRLAFVLASTTFSDERSDSECAEFLNTFVDQNALGRFLHGVGRDATEAPADMVALLDALPGNHLQTLVSLLTTERGEASRRVARSLIERYVPLNGEWLVNYLTTADAAVAVELLRTLAISDQARALDAVARLADRGEVEIQLEVLATLESMLTGPVASRLLQAYVGSVHEEVRIRSLDQVGRREVHASFGPLVARVKREAPLRLEHREAESFGIALARVDPVAAMATFRDWIKPRGFFSTVVPGAAMLQWVAVSGLALLPGDEPEALIKYASERGGSELHGHCVASMVKRRRLARGKAT